MMPYPSYRQMSDEDRADKEVVVKRGWRRTGAPSVEHEFTKQAQVCPSGSEVEQCVFKTKRRRAKTVSVASTRQPRKAETPRSSSPTNQDQRTATSVCHLSAVDS